MMEYDLPNQHQSYKPDVFFYLCSIDKSCLYHREHGLMHPADVFTTVFDEVIASGNRLVTALLEMNNDKEKRKDKHINSLISGFLYALSNFIDGCKSIIKSLFSKEDDKIYKKLISEFMKQCKSYIEYVNIKINYIKHRHRSIITILSEFEEHFILGYYVNGLISDDTTGPDPDVHKDANGAISMNWELPYHVVNIYFLSASLRYFLTQAKPTVTTGFEVGTEDIETARFINDVSLIKRFLFPDEFNKQQALIKKTKAGHLLQYPAKVKALNKHYHIMNISITTKMNFGTKAFRLPYLARQK